MRACVGKGADTRQAAIDRTSHRGADEQEGKGKDDAEGSHVTLSGYRHRLSAVVGALITMRRFRSSAPKAKNGFVARRIVSLPPSRRNNVEGIPNDFRPMLHAPVDPAGATLLSRRRMASKKQRAAF